MSIYIEIIVYESPLHSNVSLKKVMELIRLAAENLDYCQCTTIPHFPSPQFTIFSSA